MNNNSTFLCLNKASKVNGNPSISIVINGVLFTFGIQYEYSRTKYKKGASHGHEVLPFKTLKCGKISSKPIILNFKLISYKVINHNI